VFSSRKEQQQQQQQQNLSVRARVVYTARSVFVFFVCFLNERQKANEDAFTGPFPYEEGVFEEKNKPTTKTFSSRTTKKREPLLSRRRRARAWVVYYRGQSLGGFLLSSLSSSYLNEREKGKNITQRRLSLFSPQGRGEPKT
jgi:hypothetical protein